MTLRALAKSAMAADQSSSIAAASRSGRASTARCIVALSAQAAGGRNSTASEAMNDLVAATLNSGPASIGRTTSHVCASGLAVSLTIATVIAPDERAIAAVSTMSTLRPARGARLRDRKEELTVESQSAPIDGRDIRGGGGNRDPEMTLDQMLAKCGGVRRASARTGDHEAGRSPSQQRGQLGHRRRQRRGLPRQYRRRLARFRAHLGRNVTHRLRPAVIFSFAADDPQAARAKRNAP